MSVARRGWQTVACVNGHLKVPGFGQEKVPTPIGQEVGM